jgi:type I restriction enzyme S subunit
VSFPTKTRALTLTATTSGTFRADYFKYIEQEIEPDSDLWLRAGDILLQRGNSLDYVGIAAVYEGADGQFIYPDLMIKIRVGNSVNPRFAHLVLNSPFGRDFFRSRATGTSGSMPKINQGVIRGFPFPVVQLAEQHRIVAKVEELMRWCDQLEVHLATARTTATHLLDATLNQILERAA